MLYGIDSSFRGFSVSVYDDVQILVFRILNNREDVRTFEGVFLSSKDIVKSFQSVVDAIGSGSVCIESPPPGFFSSGLYMLGGLVLNSLPDSVEKYYVSSYFVKKFLKGMTGEPVRKKGKGLVRRYVKEKFLLSGMKCDVFVVRDGKIEKVEDGFNSLVVKDDNVCDSLVILSGFMWFNGIEGFFPKSDGFVFKLIGGGDEHDTGDKGEV